MITGNPTYDSIWIGTNSPSNEWTPDVTNFEVTRGGNQFGPYRGGPDVGTATVYMYFPSTVAMSVTDYKPGTVVEMAKKTAGVPTDIFFSGIIQDYVITYIPEANGAFGQRMTVYITDLVGSIQNVNIPGIVTSATTKNVSWETRMNTLATSLPYGSWTIPTSPENHIFRLVDNNRDVSLADHFDLACNSVGATWYVNRQNEFQALKKGSYPTTGMLFTDTPGYWTSLNKPANAGSTIYYNLEFQEIEFGSDTANIVNAVDLTNVMPRNMITATTGGTLRYKDPATTPGPSLECLEQPYTAEDATSVATYGRRRRNLETNVYPYRTSDTDSYYLRFNAAEDPGCEYQNTPFAQVVGTSANATISNVTPRSGTYCTNITVSTAIQSFGIYLGPTSGYPLKVRPTANVNPFTFYFRTSIAKARYRKAISYLDSAGNVLSTQFGGLLTPTVNVWNANTTTFMNYLTIPAGAVAWRPYFNIETADGTNFAVNDVFKLDDFAVNPIMEVAQNFSGDDVDSVNWLYSWEGTPGASASFVTRNILDDIGTEVLTYWKTERATISYLSWNAKQNWSALAGLEVGGRIDVRYNGTSYTAWISKIRISSDADDLIIKLDLSTRPTSWI